MTSVTNIWDHVAVDSFVGVSLQNYNKIPVIGKVLEKNESTLKIHYWKGLWNKNWMPMTYKQRRTMDRCTTKRVHTVYNYLAAFQLDNESKLQSGTKQQMKVFF